MKENTVGKRGGFLVDLDLTDLGFGAGLVARIWGREGGGEERLYRARR
jgi:hypothetical protein